MTVMAIEPGSKRYHLVDSQSKHTRCGAASAGWTRIRFAVMGIEECRHCGSAADFDAVRTELRQKDASFFRQKRAQAETRRRIAAYGAVLEAFASRSVVEALVSALPGGADGAQDTVIVIDKPAATGLTIQVQTDAGPRLFDLRPKPL
jgi:hypothetical protein